MIFNSLQFVIFFPIVVAIYYACPKKLRYIWLLACSYFFYMCWNPIYILLLLACTVITYGGALLLERFQKKKLLVGICITVLLGILAYFKYFYFLTSILNSILKLFHWSEVTIGFDVILPVGISFYTLQSIGYLIDVYRGDTPAEKNFLKYALFLAFFPQLVAGPIERSRNLLSQLFVEDKKFSLEQTKRGLVLMLWGYFLKMIIADRAAFIIDSIYGDLNTYSGFYIVVATLLFAIQIYCDFYGYSTIARGAACILGIDLMDNFKAPFYSLSIKEFWTRWHISLSYWFRDYLYIPLGGNKKGFWNKQRNLLIIFAVSGLWHGASFAYIIWGVLNGLYQNFTNVVYHFKKNKTPKKIPNILLRFRTLVLFLFSLVAFRAGNIATAIEAYKNLFRFKTDFFTNTEFFNLGVSKECFFFLVLFILILTFVDGLKYKGIDVATAFINMPWWFKTTVEVIALFVMMVFGSYGSGYDTSEFIYFQF